MQMRPTNFFNLILTLSVVVINLVVIFAPLVTYERWILVSILAIDVVLIRIPNLHWHLIHEAAHRILFTHSKLNERAGQGLSLLFFSAFNTLRFGHLLHHRTNRDEDVTEVYFEGRPPFLRYYCEIFGGFYLVTSLLLPFLSCVPIRFIRLGLALLKDKRYLQGKTYSSVVMLLSNPQKVFTLQIETLWLCLILITVSWSWAWQWDLFLVYFALRALLVSYYNNMSHYGNAVREDIYSANNAYLPKPFSTFYLNFNYHRVHHQQPLVPWWYLPTAFRQDNQTYDCNFFTSYMAQLKGPIHIKRLQEKYARRAALGVK